MALVALVSISLILFYFTIKTTTQTQCLPDQHHALIKLKQGFNTNELRSWNTSTDCCIWDGITCDEQTGMVTELDLSDRSISGELNPTLFNLSSLRYLNLARNNFINVSLPQTGFERLANLSHLDISNSGFVGQVPISICTLTKLISLDLSRVNYVDVFSTLYLHETGLKTLLNNLTKLQVLRLDGVDISLNESEWSNAVFQVGPTLKKLSMSNCGLRGNFPDKIFHLTNLTEINFSYNTMLSGRLPEFMKQSILQYLYLIDTNFTGPLPYSIGNLRYLWVLSLYNCNFFGEIPPSITNLTRIWELDLGSNILTGTIPLSLFSHPSLKSLELSDNQLSGYLPEFSRGSSILEIIDLGYNNLQGKLPTSIFTSTKLNLLDLSSNNFNGTLNLDVIKHSMNLEFLFLPNNKLSIMEGKNHNDLFYESFPQLVQLSLASSNLTKFPSFLSYQKKIYQLDLSNNSLPGENLLSICNWTLPTMLDLSYNNLIGTIPPCLLGDAKLEALNLESNKLRGPLPRNISQACVLRSINLSGNAISGSLPKLLMNCKTLELLDIGNNQIVNKFPYWLGNLQNLKSLTIRSNMFYGKISDVKMKTKGNDSFFPMLEILDLSSNHFSGTLPKNLIVNRKAMMDISIASYYRMQVLFYIIDLSNNEFLGVIPLSFCNVAMRSILDLSYNNLTGPVPPCLLEVAELEVLNLESNKLSGLFPQNISQGCQSTTINLSGNRINGSLPQSLTNCNSLEVLDLGNNQIVDRFPFWLGNLKNLTVLILRSNHFYGTISNMEAKTKTNNSFFPAIKVFDLSSNHFRGIIPKNIFGNLKAMVTDSDSSTFKFGDSGYYENSIQIIWKGEIMVIKETLSIFSSLDLSQNGFSGEIPKEIGHLKSLVGLNLSHNALTGSIPSEFSELQQLQSLDLSCNKLSGPIPQELTYLHFLSALNFSYNNLVGEIPQVPQLSTFSNASYLGNPGLCGSPLSMHCATPSNDEFNEDLPSKSSSDIIGISVSIGLGLGVGFASVIWVLISWENGRELFNFIVDRFYFRHIPWIVLHLRLAIGREQ